MIAEAVITWIHDYVNVMEMLSGLSITTSHNEEHQQQFKWYSEEIQVQMTSRPSCCVIR